jgi:hypothetical protein
MKNYDRSLMLVLFLLSMCLLVFFYGCDSKKKSDTLLSHVKKDVQKKESSIAVWHKIKVSTAKGAAAEISNPEIDYSEYSKSGDSVEDRECFGIRIRKSDETETVPWEKIKHIEITGQSKNILHAMITSTDGKSINAELEPDSKEGLCGKSGSGEFKISLKDVKAIEVLQ